MDASIKHTIAMRVIAPVGLAVLGVLTSGACAAQAASPDGFELNYFHVDRAEQAYAIGLKNGLKATFNRTLRGCATQHDHAQQTVQYAGLTEVHDA